MSAKFQVVVIGAGIGGLSLACLLAQQGHRVIVLERKPSFHALSSGGGLNLTANAIRLLNSMGIGDKLQQISDAVPQVMVMRYADARTIAVRDTNRAHVMVHRHDLLVALYERTIELGVDVKFNSKVLSIDFTSAVHLVSLGDGTKYAAELIIGADGVNSIARKYLSQIPDNGASPTSDCVFLVDVPGDLIRSQSSIEYLASLPPYQLWLGPGRCIVSWFMTARDTYHLQFCELGYHKDLPQGDGSDGSGFVTSLQDLSALKARWGDFHDSIQSILSNAQSCIKWRIATSAPLPTWSRAGGGLVLLGDAAHTFPPFAGQGAVMAIEDAACLMALLEYAQSPNDLSRVGIVYENVRRPRINEIQKVVATNVAVFALPDGQEQIARDQQLQEVAKNNNGKQLERSNDKTGGWGASRRGLFIEDYDAIEAARRAWQAHEAKL